MEKLYSAVDEVEAVLKEGKVVQLEVQEALQAKIQSIEDFIETNKNAATLDDEKLKDSLYMISKEHWDGYVEYLKDIDYQIEISGEEYHFVKDLILKDRHYGETDLFIGFKFKENFLDVIDQLYDIKRDAKIYTIKAKINDLTLLHHLMKDETAKGLTKKAVMLKNVFAMMGKIYKIFNVWNKESESISNKIYEWTKGLTPAENIPNVEQIAENAVKA